MSEFCESLANYFRRCRTCLLRSYLENHFGWILEQDMRTHDEGRKLPVSIVSWLKYLQVVQRMSGCPFNVPVSSLEWSIYFSQSIDALESTALCAACERRIKRGGKFTGISSSLVKIFRSRTAHGCMSLQRIIHSRQQLSNILFSY